MKRLEYLTSALQGPGFRKSEAQTKFSSDRVCLQHRIQTELPRVWIDLSQSQHLAALTNNLLFKLSIPRKLLEWEKINEPTAAPELLHVFSKFRDRQKNYQLQPSGPA